MLYSSLISTRDHQRWRWQHDAFCRRQSGAQNKGGQPESEKRYDSLRKSQMLSIYSCFPMFLADSDSAGRLQSFDVHDEAQTLIHRRFLSSIPQIDPNVLNDIEIEAQYLASNIDNLTENLCNLLHSVWKIRQNYSGIRNLIKNLISNCFFALADLIDSG